MTPCPHCELPMVASPAGDLWCSVWGRHGLTTAGTDLTPLMIACVDEMAPYQRGLPGGHRHLRAVS